MEQISCRNQQRVANEQIAPGSAVKGIQTEKFSLCFFSRLGCSNSPAPNQVNSTHALAEFQLHF